MMGCARSGFSGFQDAVNAWSFPAAGIIQLRIDQRFPSVDINPVLNHVRSGASHGRVVIVAED